MYEGFFHLTGMEGNVEKAALYYYGGHVTEDPPVPMGHSGIGVTMNVCTDLGGRMRSNPWMRQRPRGWSRTWLMTISRWQSRVTRGEPGSPPFFRLLLGVPEIQSRESMGTRKSRSIIVKCLRSIRADQKKADLYPPPGLWERF